ncbi:uncharacterized protein LOC134024599 isoform X2 [Osmerus eperlanus]|uniref:uncharacterized protein LOC134024599 isoform X2 n=1 Tax=Osmerus eperlanus TaxID=29151 RepID=UPI002E15A075
MTTVMSEGKQVNPDPDVLEDALKEPEPVNEVTEEGSYEYIKGPKKVFFLPCGEVLGSDEQILQHLIKDTYLTKVESVEKCDLILAGCPIVSRVGTDIAAFLEKCNEPGMLEKRLVLMVLHHTFDPDYTIPDINRHVTRNNVLAVNFLFHGTQGGLLTCPQNDEALKKISSELGSEADHGILQKRGTSGSWYIQGTTGKLGVVVAMGVGYALVAGGALGPGYALVALSALGAYKCASQPVNSNQP